MVSLGSNKGTLILTKWDEERGCMGELSWHLSFRGTSFLAQASLPIFVIYLWLVVIWHFTMLLENNELPIRGKYVLNKHLGGSIIHHDPWIILPFSVRAFLPHGNPPFSHSIVLLLFFHGEPCVKPWLLYLQMRESHGIIVAGAYGGWGLAIEKWRKMRWPCGKNHG